jgi:hypothetical protein
LPTRFPFLSSTAAHPQARRSGRSAPFRCRPLVRHNFPHRPPCRVRKRPHIILHQLVVGLVAGNAVQGQRRRTPAARRQTPATPPPHPARTRPGPSDLARAALITYPFVLKGRSTVDPCTGCTAAVGSKIHGPAAALSFKSPWEILNSHAGPPTYMFSCS